MEIWQCSECKELMISCVHPQEGWRFNSTCFQHNCKGIIKIISEGDYGSDYPYASEKLSGGEVLSIISQLRAELEKHCWIPVSERLPKDEYDILAYGYDGYGYKIVINTSYNLEFKKFRILSEVTHWKPIILPEQALQNTNTDGATGGGRDAPLKENKE